MAAVAFVEKNMCGLSATTYATSAVVLVISERAALLLPARCHDELDPRYCMTGWVSEG
jgi:hypothetical protein